MNDISAPGLTFSCPFCGLHFTVESNGAGQEVICPGCQKHVVIPEPLVSEPEPWWRGKAVRTAGVLVLGIVTPMVQVLAMGLCGLTGPLAFIAAPVVGFYVVRLSAGYVYQNHGERWFWLYTGVGLVVWVAQLRVFLGSLHDGPENPVAPLFYGLIALLAIAGAVIWLVATLWTWFRRE